MKKVLSVLLAAAMVMGMSVSAMAKTVEYSPESTIESVAKKDILKDGSNFEWGYCHQLRGGVKIDEAIDTTDLKLEEGDNLYFGIKFNGEAARFMPSDWTLKINNAEYVEDAEFVLADDIDGLNDGQLYSQSAESFSGAGCV